MDPLTAVAVWGASLAGIVALVRAARRSESEPFSWNDSDEE